MLMLKTWRDILARKGQFFGLVLLVALGIATFVAFRTAYLDLVASVDRANRDLLFADFSTEVMGAPLGELRAIRRLPGVHAAEGRIVRESSLDMARGERAKARVVGIPDGVQRVNALLLRSGRMPVTGRDEALLHVKFATETGTDVGDTLTLKLGRARRQVRVVGIVASPEYMYAVPEKGTLPSPREFAVLFMRDRDVEDLVGVHGTVTDVSVLVEPGASVADVVRRVEGVLEPYRVVGSVLRADQPSSFMLAEEIEQNRIMAGFLPAVILAISASSLLIALSRLVTSQRGEIGLAKALGYTDGQILVHYLAFALIVAAAGSLLGFLLGDPIARAIAREYVSMLGVPFLDHHVYPEVALVASAISALACLLAALAPAWRSSCIAPAQAMHSDPNAALAGGRVPLV
jgi:putative ABC transport system permease protein